MFRIIIIILTVLSFSSTLIGQPSDDCGEKNVYLRVNEIDPVDAPLWIQDDCTEAQPWENNLWYDGTSYKIYNLVKGDFYNEPPVGKVEYFWFRGGCCGKIICIDDNNLGAVQANRIKLQGVNTCYDTSVWMDFCTQCEDCNNNQTAPKGRWWKYEQQFQEMELDIYQSTSTALSIHLGYQMLVDCVWQADYGCDPGELN